MEALPIFLNSLMADWGAILVSVTLILLFGEILPQSICTRYGLAVGATMAPVVHWLVWLCFPVAFPISKILDYLLGDGHVALFRRAELQALVTMHGNEAGKGGELSHQETSIISGALELAGKTALHAMTLISETFSLDIDETLDREKMILLLEKGHSRVPVFFGKPTNIIGLILVKNLLALDLTKEVHICNVTIRKIPRVSSNMPLYDILNEFRKGHSHMAVVVNFPEKREQDLERASNVEAKISRSPSREEVLSKEEHVTLNVVDSDALQDFHDHSVTDKSPQSTCKISSNAILSVKTIQRSKRWSETVSEDILQINNEPLPTFAEDEKVVGIITMEDVIEEILQAMQEEMMALNSHDTWDHVSLPEGRKPIGYKWVYKKTIRADGWLEWYKAILVAKDYSQREGVGFSQVLSSIAKLPSIRFELSIVAACDFETENEW